MKYLRFQGDALEGHEAQGSAGVVPGSVIGLLGKYVISCTFWRCLVFPETNEQLERVNLYLTAWASVCGERHLKERKDIGLF